MLSIDGFKHHLGMIEHETKMYMHYKHDVSLQSVENSKAVLLNNFLEMKQEIIKLKSMIENGLTFEDLYNPDDEINPHCR